MFNHVTELIDQHFETAAYCCELEDVEEISELEDRLKSFEPSAFALLKLHSDFTLELLTSNDVVSSWSLQRTFYPHALHVPIYLDKGVLLV